MHHRQPAARHRHAPRRRGRPRRSARRWRAAATRRLRGGAIGRGSRIGIGLPHAGPRPRPAPGARRSPDDDCLAVRPRAAAGDVLRAGHGARRVPAAGVRPCARRSSRSSWSSPVRTRSARCSGQGTGRALELFRLRGKAPRRHAVRPRSKVRCLIGSSVPMSAAGENDDRDVTQRGLTPIDWRADDPTWGSGRRTRSGAVDEVLTRAGIFQGVEPYAAEALAQALETAEFARGATSSSPRASPATACTSSRPARSRSAASRPDGRENLLMVAGPSDMFGELSIFDPGPRTSSATAVTEVRAYTMDRTALREWIGKRPEIAEQLLRVLARRLRRTNNMLADLIFTDVPGRVAKALLQLARQFGSQESGLLRVTHDLTQEEIAQLVGASPRDGEQGAGRLRPPRLAAAGGQERADPGARAPGPPRPLSLAFRRASPPGVLSAGAGNNWYGRTRMCHPGRHVQLVVPRRLPRRADRSRRGACRRCRSAVGRLPDRDVSGWPTLLYVQRRDGLVRRRRAGVGGLARRRLAAARSCRGG